MRIAYLGKVIKYAYMMHACQIYWPWCAQQQCLHSQIGCLLTTLISLINECYEQAVTSA